MPGIPNAMLQVINLAPSLLTTGRQLLVQAQALDEAVNEVHCQIREYLYSQQCQENSGNQGNRDGPAPTDSAGGGRRAPVEFPAGLKEGVDRQCQRGTDGVNMCSTAQKAVYDRILNNVAARYGNPALDVSPIEAGSGGQTGGLILTDISANTSGSGPLRAPQPAQNSGRSSCRRCSRIGQGSSSGSGGGTSGSGGTGSETSRSGGTGSGTSGSGGTGTGSSSGEYETRRYRMNTSDGRAPSPTTIQNHCELIQKLAHWWSSFIVHSFTSSDEELMDPRSEELFLSILEEIVLGWSDLSFSTGTSSSRSGQQSGSGSGSGRAQNSGTSNGQSGRSGRWEQSGDGRMCQNSRGGYSPEISGNSESGRVQNNSGTGSDQCPIGLPEWRPWEPPGNWRMSQNQNQTRNGGRPQWLQWLWGSRQQQPPPGNNFGPC